MSGRNIRRRSDNDYLVEQRRRQIVAQASQLFWKKGLANTTVRDIGRACHITHGAIYRYVGKKDDIVSLIVQDAHRVIWEFIRMTEDVIGKKTSAEVLSEAIGGYYRMVNGVTGSHIADFISANYAFFRPSVRLRVIETMEAVTAVFEKILKDGCVRGDFCVDNTWMCASNIVGLGQLYALRRHVYSKRFTLEQYIDYQNRQILKQICLNNISSCDTEVHDRQNGKST